jgi:hypothetical protein
MKIGVKIPRCSASVVSRYNKIEKSFFSNLKAVKAKSRFERSKIRGIKPYQGMKKGKVGGEHMGTQ